MNEPVAWMNRLGRLEYEQGNGFEIPLYTHPVKELTDEEIWKLWQKHYDTIQKAATMLRQQQAEIEFLKLQVEEAIKLAVTEIQKRQK